MRVQQLQQRLGDLGKLVVDLVLNAPGKQGKCLDQALDVRISATIFFQLQPARDLGIPLRKLGAHLANELQLTLVIGVKLFHGQPPLRHFEAADVYRKVNVPGGKAFADFMVAPQTQAVIKTFGVDKFGAPLFFPDAGKKEETLGK